jgi:group II intron reverse transcriptase/maturase
MNLRKETKSYPITKEQVWEAFKLVRSSKGSMGVDGISIETIGQQPQKYLYPLWNRMASGSYFPPPVKRVEIPKGNGKKRALGIPTVKDRVAQMVIAKELEGIVEPHFSGNSFGYRPNKSAHQAIEQARKNCWNYAWVIDLDIQGFFDSIDHGLMIRALRYFTNDKHIITYCKRWLKAPIQQKDGTLIPNEETGTPQGGVISPVLANIFLHVVFDKWIERKFADCPFERYADDIIIHVKNEVYAKQVLKAVKERFEQCKLTLHPDKTKLVYCNRKGRKKRTKADHQQFDFLGFTFRPRQVQTKTGELVFGFSPSISRKSIKRIVRECLKLGFHRWIHMDFHQLAKALSSKIRGWINYYGKFHISALKEVFRHLNERLVKWIFNKYKRFKRLKTRFFAKLWLRKISNDYEYLFPHWKYGFKP